LPNAKPERERECVEVKTMSPIQLTDSSFSHCPKHDEIATDFLLPAST